MNIPPRKSIVTVLQTDAWHRFLRLYAIVFLIGLLALGLLEKGEMVLWLARHRTEFLNGSMRAITLLGDGIMVAVLGIAVAFIRYKYTLTLVAIGLGQLILSAFLKRTVFGNLPRPQRYFTELDPSWLVEGVEVHSNYAFPSGHTITAFSLCFFIALMIDRQWVTVSMLILSVLIGFSRIYLFQHFLEDVVAGSIAGVAVTGGIFAAMANWTDFWQNLHLQRGLLPKRYRP